MKSAAQVGLFVVVALVLFAAGIAFVGRGLFSPRRDTYSVAMPDAGGLAKGSRVLMAGVPVGEVTKLQVVGPQQARLEIAVEKGTRLPLSTRALVSASLVGLGDTPISLVQDPGYRGAVGYFTPGNTLLGGKAGPLDGILPNGGTELYTQLNETLRAVRILLQDNGLKKDVRGLLATTQQTLLSSQNTLQALTRAANQGSEVLTANQGEIAQILRTSEGTLSSVQETALAIERYAKSGKLQGSADTLLADAHRIAVESQNLIVDLRKTLNDPALNADLRASADNLAKTTEKLPPLVDKADRIAANVETITAKSQDLPDKLGKALDNASGLEERLGGLVDKAGGLIGGGRRSSFPPIQVQLDLLRESDPGYWRTDLNLTVPISDGFVTAGLWDAFGRNRVNLQLGKTVNSVLDYRYGIYGGRPAIGVDYRLAPKLGFRGDLWDINDPRFDARLRYELGGGLVGWLGVEKIFQDPSLTIGFGVRR